MAGLSAEERLSLINENLAEVLNPEIIESIIATGRNPKIYWGTATTGQPHCGYLVPAVKIAQFLAAGCEVTILLADIHATLDSNKAPFALVDKRAEYYKFIITSMLKACGVPIGQLKFIYGSTFQKSDKYVTDLLRLSTRVPSKHAFKAGSQIVKQSADPPMSNALYPLMQVLDEEHLDCDAQFGGVDQRKLFTAAIEWLPKIGYRKRAHLMNSMVAGLNGDKMSSSDEGSKIGLLDSADAVDKKMKKAQCVPNQVEGNGVLALVKYILLPVSGLKTGTRQFKVERCDAEPLVYTNIKQVEEDYENNVLTPQILKPAVSAGLNRILSSIIADYQASQEWQEVTQLAYPPPVKEKAKKPKNLGTRFPGANGGRATNTKENVTKEIKNLTIAGDAPIEDTLDN